MTTTRAWFLIVFAHVVVLALLCLSGPAGVVRDAAGYWRLGRLFADGDFSWGAAPIAYRTPGYPAFLGAIQALAGNRAWLVSVAAQHLLVVLTAAATAWIVCQLTESRRFAMTAYALTALGLVRTWYAQALLTETLFVFLLVVHFACLLHCLSRVSIGRCIAVGVTLAAATLVRPVVQLWWLPAFGLITAIGSGAPLGQRFRRSLVGGSCMALLLLPWFVRNQHAFGEPFLTRFLGRNLWIVTFQDGAGAGLGLPDTDAGGELLGRTGWEAGDPQLTTTWAVSNRLSSTGLPDDEVDQMMRQVCLDAIRDDPVRFGRSAAARWINFWRCVPDPYPYLGDVPGEPPPGQSAWGSAGLSRWEAVLYGSVLQRSLRWNELIAACTFVGTILMIRDARMRWLGVGLLLFFMMVSGLTALVEIPNVRYRMVLEPLMVVSICCGLYRLSRSRGPSPGPPDHSPETQQP